ncbi:hypothetical protein [Pontibacillus litoralis]|uniref:Uncharacterized protein n=1 Tax=Pontibacillus litoralis JSM 072002 TaxID=1385512 RepID=A0A0A5G940_9BACI|nr:hypothetical protein [Pontibacillus litoralis]KGX87698.1 hypothetical protein N784_13830 [Pontibacillus litoralis JSM 072002]
MVRSHMNRLTKNKVSLCVFIVIILIPVWDAMQVYIEFLQVGGEKLHPAHAFFLSGASMGHVPQYVLLWFLPLFLLVLGTEDSIQDFRTGYYNILVSKIGIKRYIKEKMFFSFMLGFVAMGITLSINLCLTFLLFFGGDYTKWLTEDIFESSFTSFTIQNPYIGVLIYSLIAMILAGLAGLLGATCSLFFKDRKYTYAATFFLWYIFVTIDQSSMHLIQPFTEYSLTDTLPIFWVILVAYLAMSIIVYIYEVKNNEPI